MRNIRFGIFGLRRGSTLAPCIGNAGAQIVAICDARPEAIAQCKETCECCRDAAEYTDFDQFIQHDMDAVLVANYFCEHAPYAIKAMRAGKHVLSETTSNITMAEGVELCRVKEETGMTYALFENYPYIRTNIEMGRLCREGSLGHILYAEGEYVHILPKSDFNKLSPGIYHWRNWTPATYYITHALAPLMQMTGARPVRVSAMVSYCPELAAGTAVRKGDAAAVILCETDVNSVFRLISGAAFQPAGNHYRLCGSKGGVEVNPATGQIRLRYNPWDTPAGQQTIREYTAEWPDPALGKSAEKAGHGGSDFFAMYHFIRDLENGREPFWDVYRATTAASVGIMAWRSVLNRHMAYDIPDFRREEDRLRFESDRISPYPDENGHAVIPCSSHPRHPSKEDLAIAQSCWDSLNQPSDR